MDNFIAGLGYGATSVVVGQPLDTIKTRMQVLGTPSIGATMKNIMTTDGPAGFYRGGMVLVLGGSLFRSTQFGVYEFVHKQLVDKFGKTKSEDRIFNIFDPQVVFAGFMGGIGRGFVEGPFEFIKTRRQVHEQWKITEVFNGSGATVFRNSFLFSSFMIYVDLTNRYIPGGLSPFWSGAVCANLAWLTIWPLDVVKSQIQSGLYKGQSLASLVMTNLKTGVFYRGLLPGLTRSFISNGCSMVVYKKVLTWLQENKNTPVV